MSTLQVVRPGLVPYGEAFAWQQRRADEVRAGAAETLAVLQHPPVYTLGMRGNRANVLVPVEALEARGAEVVQADRGGDVTFHGPGQLVAYPILDLRARELGPATYVRMLEACVIETLAAFRIDAGRVSGRPGVWVGDSKVAAVGVRVRGGVSTHGLALNVTTDLGWFEAIVPCGIVGAGVTSVASLLGSAAPEYEAVEDVFVEVAEQMFHVKQPDALAAVGAPS